MIVPSIDIQGGQAVQLVGGKELAIERGDQPGIVDPALRIFDLKLGSFYFQFQKGIDASLQLFNLVFGELDILLQDLARSGHLETGQSLIPETLQSLRQGRSY